MELKCKVFYSGARPLLAFLFLQCLEHRRKVNQLPPSKPKEEEEEKIPTEKGKDAVEQEAKPPLNAGNEKDLKMEKENVSDLESVVNLFSAKVRITSDFGRQRYSVLL